MSQNACPGEQTQRLRYGKYVKPYLAWFIIGPVLMIIEVVGEVLLPKLLAAIINYGVTDIPKEEWPGWVVTVYGWFGENTSALVVALAFGMMLTAIIMMIGGVGGAWFGTRASVNFAADLRADLYRKVQSYSFANIDKFSTGSLVTRLTNDVTQIQNFVSILLRMALRAPGMLIGAMIMSFLMCASYNDFRLFGIIGIFVPILAAGIVLFIKIASPRFMAVQTKVDGLNSGVQESVTNVRVVKSFVREDFEAQRFAGVNRDLRQTGMSAFKVMVCMSPLMSLLMNSATLCVLWFGGNMVLTGDLAVGDLSAFVTYITQILSSLMMVSMLFIQASRASASSKRIRAVMEEKIDISDSDADPSLCVERGDIEFRDVTFRYYKSSPAPVLDRVSFKVSAGQTVGIIGSTGSGKSTLVSMIPRLYDPDEGQVLVDGVDVKRYSLYNLREGVGMVLQKNVLFTGTVRDNLLWGNPDADQAEVTRAATAAQADGFVNSFGHGYDSDIEQGGSNVSGGQKQRLCIARALLKKPKILILDDSTSAVDTATEAKIRKAFRTSLSKTTKLIIAQRITSVMEADVIIVVNEGMITGIGTHDELLADNTEYREIYASQMESASSAPAVPEKEVAGV